MKQKKESFLPTIDELTGLSSPAAFKTGFNNMRESHPEEKFALVIVEASGLQSINEQLGFEKGDRHLIEIANVIKKSDSSLETDARMGGNRFAIALHFDTKQKSL